MTTLALFASMVWCIITGTVHSADGRPLSGAYVAAYADDNVYFSNYTTGDGRYTLEAGCDYTRLKAFGPHHESAAPRRGTTDFYLTPLSNNLLLVGGRVSERTTNMGVDATIILNPCAAFNVEPVKAYTDEHGYYQLGLSDEWRRDVVLSNCVVLEAHSDSHVPYRETWSVDDLMSGTPIDLVLWEWYTIFTPLTTGGGITKCQ